MTTITVNERTKAGKSFLEFAKNLPFVKINDEKELVGSTFKKTVLTNKEKAYLENLRKVAIEVKTGNYVGQSVKSFFDEL